MKKWVNNVGGIRYNDIEIDHIILRKKARKRNGLIGIYFKNNSYIELSFNRNAFKYGNWVQTEWRPYEEKD